LQAGQRQRRAWTARATAGQLLRRPTEAISRCKAQHHTTHTTSIVLQASVCCASIPGFSSSPHASVWPRFRAQPTGDTVTLLSLHRTDIHLHPNLQGFPVCRSFSGLASPRTLLCWLGAAHDVTCTCEALSCSSLCRWWIQPHGRRSVQSKRERRRSGR
jgi:hypothetical protein